MPIISRPIISQCLIRASLIVIIIVIETLLLLARGDKSRTKNVVCFVIKGSFCFSFVFRVYAVFYFLVFGCQYQCNRLLEETRLRNDLLCVEWDILNPAH